MVLLCPFTEVQGLQVSSENLRAALALLARASKIIRTFQDEKEGIGNRLIVDIGGITMRSEADAADTAQSRAKVRLTKVLVIASAGSLHPLGLLEACSDIDII